MADAHETVFSTVDLETLRGAKRRLEHPGLMARISDFLGKPLETGFRLLPKRVHKLIGSSTQMALRKALEFSLLTLGRREPRRSRDRLHKTLAVGMGAVGGAVGLAALPVELPLTTCVILRSIADIARSEGHDLSRVEVQLACLEVFALGGTSSKDDASESGYWVVRGTLAKYLSDAAEHLARKGFADQGAPVLVRLLAKLASRFSIVVTEEAVATAVPVLGALSGGTINYLFMTHFQEMARGHFVVMRLEKTYSTDLVRRTYDSLAI